MDERNAIAAPKRGRSAALMPRCRSAPARECWRLARRDRRLAPVVVEAALGLAAEPARLDVLHEQRAGPVLGIGEPLVQHLHYGEAGIQADEIGELERPHGMVGAELHRG